MLIFFANTVFNEAIESNKRNFLSKLANITSVYKKRSKSQYRTRKRFIDHLVYYQYFLKYFKKTSSKQLSSCFENILSKFQSGFTNGFSTHRCCLLLLTRKLKEAVLKEKAFGVLLADLLEAFVLAMIF